jgi:hypothetical protein
MSFNRDMLSSAALQIKLSPMLFELKSNIEKVILAVNGSIPLPQLANRTLYIDAYGLLNTITWKKGNNSIIAFCGDLIDRRRDNTVVDEEYNDMNILRCVLRLKREARENGGDILICVGNHEWLNIIEDPSYTVGPKEYTLYGNIRDEKFMEELKEINEKLERGSILNINNA